MNWLAWTIPTFSYLFLVIYFWRRFAWRIAWKEAARWSHRSTIDGGNVATGLFLGFFQAVAWPVVLIALRGTSTEAFYGFLREPYKSKKQVELEERERRILALERELNIRG